MKQQRPALRFIVLPLLLILLTSQQAVSATYFVSAKGDDKNSGLSEEQAFATIERINALTFAPGDRILFRGGDSFEGELILGADDAGTAKAPVTIDSFGKGRAKIIATLGNGIYIENAGGIEIRNLIIESAEDSTASSHGILFLNYLDNSTKLEHIRIENVDVSGFEIGILVYAEASDFTTSGYHDVQISHVRAFGNLYAGIAVDALEDHEEMLQPNSEVHIKNSIVYDNLGDQYHASDAGHGIFLGGVNKGSLKYNIAYNNGTKEHYAGDEPIDFVTLNSKDITYKHNESFGHQDSDFTAPKPALVEKLTQKTKDKSPKVEALKEKLEEAKPAQPSFYSVGLLLGSDSVTPKHFSIFFPEGFALPSAEF